MLMPGIPKRDAEGADLGAIEDGQQLLHRYVVLVWALPVAPADMQPDLLGRDVRESEVQRLDVKLDPLEEVAKRPLAEHDDALHGEIGRVDLQDVALGDDVVVFLLELPRDTHHVVTIGRVDGIVLGPEQRRCHDAG